MMVKAARRKFSEFEHLSIRDRLSVASRYSSELVVMAAIVPTINGTDLEPILTDLASDLKSMTSEMATGRLGTEIIVRAAMLVLLMEHLLEDTPPRATVH